MRFSAPAWIVLLASLVGGLVRFAFRDYTTSDTYDYLLPWYAFAAAQGWGALDDPFTNYAPMYGYFLIGVAKLNGAVAPLLLIKSISFVFELAAALVAYRLVRRLAAETSGAKTRAAIAYAAVWLAPTVIFNGAMWGQADSIWGCFLLLSILLFCTERNGSVPFGLAFAMKAQGIFLGPFVLGMALRGRVHWMWLCAPAAAYAVLAAPAVIAGRSAGEVASVYLSQAGTFHQLSKSAANLWIFAPDGIYALGVVAGLVFATVAGIALALLIARSKRIDAPFLLLAACAALFLGPFLLPKMHERYFYAFELATIVLACVHPRYAAFAVMAQVNGVFAYLHFDRGIFAGLPVAAICNTFIGLALVRELRAPQPLDGYPRAWTWVSYAVLTGAMVAFVFSHDPSKELSAVYYGLMGLIALQAATLLRPPSEMRGPAGSAP